MKLSNNLLLKLTNLLSCVERTYLLIDCNFYTIYCSISQIYSQVHVCFIILSYNLLLKLTNRLSCLAVPALSDAWKYSPTDKPEGEILLQQTVRLVLWLWLRGELWGVGVFAIYTALWLVCIHGALEPLVLSCSSMLYNLKSF